MKMERANRVSKLKLQPRVNGKQIKQPSKRGDTFSLFHFQHE